MAPQDELLKGICHSNETYHEAQTILRTAKQRTGPLSGYYLGPLITGLPAVCAYIASTNLNNTDVTRKNAQIASCLKESDFNRVLETVKAAFDDRPRRTRSGKDVYDTLAKKYPLAPGHNLLNEWTGAVKRTLMQSDDGFGSNESSAPDLDNAIFFWIYTAATGKNPALQRDFAAEHCTSAKLFTNLLNKINDCCTSVKNRIKNDVIVQRSPAKASATSTPRRTPKRPPRILPSRDSPNKRKVVETPARLESGDELDLISDTPSKKRKPESSKEPILPSPTKLTFPPVASSSHVTLDGIRKTLPRAAPGLGSDCEVMNVDEEANVVPSEESEDDDVVEPHIRRRYRSVYADHKQWYAVDRCVKYMRKQAERYKLSRSELNG